MSSSKLTQAQKIKCDCARAVLGLPAKYGVSDFWVRFSAMNIIPSPKILHFLKVNYYNITFSSFAEQIINRNVSPHKLAELATEHDDLFLCCVITTCIKDTMMPSLPEHVEDIIYALDISISQVKALLDIGFSFTDPVEILPKGIEKTGLSDSTAEKLVKLLKEFKYSSP